MNKKTENYMQIFMVYCDRRVFIFNFVITIGKIIDINKELHSKI